MAKERLNEQLLDALAKRREREGVPQLVCWDSELPGFGVVVGKTARTFIADARVDGKKRRTTVAVAGHVRADGNRWTVKLARIEAKTILGTMAAGINPNADRQRADGPTLREAMQTHLDKMKKKHRSERSIETLEGEMKRYLGDWLDRAIADLTGEVLVDLHEQIKANAAKRTGTNPKNAKGAPLANRVIAHVSASWRSLNKKLGGKLGSWNPASSVEKDTLKPSRERIDDDALPDYAARVKTMRSKIRQDGLMLALYTGLRHEDVRTIRFEHIDWEASTLRLPDPKGGENAAFTIPLSVTPMTILERRKRDNAIDVGAADDGWVFPGVNHDGIGAIDNLRQHQGKNAGRFPVEDVHSLRRTWESIAQQEGVSELDQHVLSNHSFGSHNVNATYISQHIGHLASCAEKIDAGITRRIAGKKRALRAA